MNWLNDLIPWLGIAQVIYAMRSNHYFTQPSATGAFFMLALIFWLSLIWADWIEGFVPVWQTTIARMILFVMIGLVMYLVKVKRCKAY